MLGSVPITLFLLIAMAAFAIAIGLVLPVLFVVLILNVRRLLWGPVLDEALREWAARKHLELVRWRFEDGLPIAQVFPWPLQRGPVCRATFLDRKIGRPRDAWIRCPLRHQDNQPDVGRFRVYWDEDILMDNVLSMEDVPPIPANPWPLEGPGPEFLASSFEEIEAR